MAGVTRHQAGHSDVCIALVACAAGRGLSVPERAASRPGCATEPYRTWALHLDPVRSRLPPHGSAAALHDHRLQHLVADKAGEERHRCRTVGLRAAGPGPVSLAPARLPRRRRGRLERRAGASRRATSAARTAAAAAIIVGHRPAAQRTRHGGFGWRARAARLHAAFCQVCRRVARHAAKRAWWTGSLRCRPGCRPVFGGAATCSGAGTALAVAAATPCRAGRPPLRSRCIRLGSGRRGCRRVGWLRRGPARGVLVAWRAAAPRGQEERDAADRRQQHHVAPARLRQDLPRDALRRGCHLLNKNICRLSAQHDRPLEQRLPQSGGRHGGRRLHGGRGSSCGVWNAPACIAARQPTGHALPHGRCRRAGGAPAS